jgi:Holliday junction DNA helicase RuvA
LVAYLNGKIALKTPTHIYVECGGVGYHVNISLHTYSKLESLESIKILTYHHVREEEQSLYGFFDDEERLLFVQLISVSGIGVNTARVILSYMTPEEVRTAIIHENAVALSKVKGIGPKTAKQIILDLKEKVMKTGIDSPALHVTIPSNAIKDEALAALLALGFPKAAVEKHIKSVLDKQPDISLVEDLIKNVLKQMN